MRSRTHFIFIIALSLYGCYDLWAQGVGVNTDGSAPDASAILDVKSTDRGLLVPRVSLSDVTSASPVTSPATGLLVYNTNASVTGGNGTGFYYWDGSQWVRLDAGNSGAWRLTGNAGTSPASNFLGTTDAQDLVFRTNNNERMRILSGGDVGIGTASPTHRLHVNGAVRAENGFLANDGTAGVPAYRFNSDTDVGMFRPAADQIGFAMTGVEKLRINGNAADALVGINNNSPSAPLDFVRTTSNSMLVGTNYGNAPNYDLRRAQGTPSSPTIIGVNGVLARLRALGYDGSAFQTAAQIAFETDAATGSGDMPGRIVFSTTPDGSTALAERMRITNNGFVGIGTTSPGGRLEINGSTTTNAGIALRVNNSGGPGVDNTFLVIENDGAIQVGTSPLATLSTDNIGKSAITIGDQNVAHSNGGSGGGVNQAAIAIGRRSEVYHSGGSSASVAIGESNRIGTTSAYVNNSYALGSLLRNTQSNTLTLGMGPNVGFTNGTSGTIMMVNNSTVPSLTVVAGDGSGTPGNVGIGLTTPLTPLHVHAPTTSLTFEISRFTNGTTGSATGDGTAFGFANNGLNFYMDNKEGAGFQWWTSGTERMRLAGNGIFSLNNNNTTAYPPYNSNGGGAISWNFGAGTGEVSLWNNVSAGSPRGFSFRQMTSASSQTELMRVQGTGEIFGRFRHVTYHSFNNASWSGNPANAVQWFPCPGGDGCDDNRIGGTGTPSNDHRREWVAPYSGRIVRVIVRVGNDSGSNPEFRGRICRSFNGVHALMNNNADGANENAWVSFECTQNNSFNRGDRIAVGIDMNCASCYFEDTNYFVTIIWDFDMWD